MIENQHYDWSTHMKKVLMQLAWKCYNHVCQLQNSFWDEKSPSQPETNNTYIIWLVNTRIDSSSDIKVSSDSSTHLALRLTLWKQYLYWFEVSGSMATCMLLYINCTVKVGCNYILHHYIFLNISVHCKTEIVLMWSWCSIHQRYNWKV